MIKVDEIYIFWKHEGGRVNSEQCYMDKDEDGSGDRY